MIASGKTLRQIPDLIHPFNERSKAFGMTYGVGPAGYDMRVEFDQKGEEEDKIMGPGEFLLASTIEEFNMPDNLLGIVHDKSTWARMGLTVQNTVIEPGWKGFLTLELTNHSSRNIILMRGMPICQVVFHYIDRPAISYTDGKYQNQRRGPVAAIFDN